MIEDMVDARFMADEPFIQETLDKMIPALSEAAAHIKPAESGLIALDWLNGLQARRSRNS